jgi:hypothetical protein
MKNISFICTDKLGVNLSVSRVSALVESFSPKKPVVIYHLDDIPLDAVEQIPYIEKMEAVENHTIIVYGFTRCPKGVLNTLAKIMIDSDKNNIYIIINNKQESEDIETLGMSMLNRFIFMDLSNILTEKYFQ